MANRLKTLARIQCAKVPPRFARQGQRPARRQQQFTFERDGPLVVFNLPIYAMKVPEINMSAVLRVGCPQTRLSLLCSLHSSRLATV